MGLYSNRLVLSIPHCSTFIPKSIYDSFFYPKLQESMSFAALSAKKKMNVDYELLVMTDWYTDELFDSGLCPAVKARVSRLVCDIERFLDEEREPMSKKGMGVCYTHGFDHNRLKDVDSNHRTAIIDEFYNPYHHNLEEKVGYALDTNKSAIILDCHSFYPISLPYEGKSINAFRPDICIGTDSFHTPEYLEEFAFDYFNALGYRVAVNTPFSGSLVPLKWYQKDSRVLSIMIELNRGIYLKSGTNEKSNNFEVLRSQLFDFERKLLEYNVFE